MALSAAIAVAALGASGSAGAAGTPIKVGAIVSETGPAPFVDWAEGAKAFFNRLNKHGGINGHPVDLIYVDDKGDPTQTAALARQLVGDGVVAFVGSLSLNDCGVNRQYYVQQKIVSIDIGGEAACFNTPNIAPVNSGPKLDEESQLLYAYQFLHQTKNCYFTFNVQGFNATFRAAAVAYTKITHHKLLKTIYDFPQNADVTPAVIAFSKAGCKTVSYSGVESQAIEIAKAVKQQNIHGITWLTGLGPYSPGFYKAAGNTGNGLIAMLEYVPFDSPLSKQPLADFKASGYPAIQTMDTGWTAAYVFTHVASAIKGAVTRDAVTHAFKTLKPFKVPTMGTPFTFGPGPAHTPNHAAFASVLKNGKFVYTGHKIIIDYTK